MMMQTLEKHKLKFAAATAGVGLVLYAYSSSKASKSTTEDTKEKEKKSKEMTEQEIALRVYGVKKVGSAADIQTDYTGGLLKLSRKVEESNEGVGYIDVYGNPSVIVTKPDYVRYVLAHNVFNTHWGGITAASRAFFGKNVLFILMGDEWRRLRRCMKFALTSNNVEQMKSDVFASAYQLADTLEDRIGKEIDINLVAGMYHLDAIGRSAYNYDFGCLKSYTRTNKSNAIVDSFEFLLIELPRRALAPDQSVLGDYSSDNEDNRRWKHAAQTVREQVFDAVHRRIEERKGVAGKRNDILDALIDAYKEEALTEKELFELIGDNIVEILFAGYNTNVGTISTAIYFICEHPEFLKKIQREVRKKQIQIETLIKQTIKVDLVIPDSYNPGDTIDESKLVNCKNAFYETLRLSPPAPLIARFTVDDVALGDKFIIPKSTSIWIPAEYIQTNRASWGEDAAKFNPDRWNQKKPCPLGAFIPFSHGPRECVGKHFATLEAIAALAFLFKRLEFDIAKDYKFKPSFNGFGYRPSDATTNKICVRVTPRTRR